MCAWVSADGRAPTATVQVRNAWATVNLVLAYWQAVGRSGAAAARARMAGSWCHCPNWRSSRRWGWPSRVSRRRASQAW